MPLSGSKADRIAQTVSISSSLTSVTIPSDASQFHAAAPWVQAGQLKGN